MESGNILMGYKGQSFIDCGYFYAPYIPLTSTPVVLDPNKFNSRKGILTRYGRKLLNEAKPVEPPVKPPRYRSIDDDWCEF